MKAISIKQPWAQLIAIGLKDIENRSWPTKYRGRLFIHASQKIVPGIETVGMLLNMAQYVAVTNIEEKMRADIMLERVLTGAIIGEVEVIGCVNNSDSIWAEPGQWHWQLNNARLYEQPLLNVKGKLSLWEFNRSDYTKNT